MTEYIHIDEHDIQQIKSYVQNIFDTEITVEACNKLLKRPYITITTNILHTQIHDILYESCILPKDILNIINYYIDFNSVVIIKLIMVKFDNSNTKLKYVRIQILGPSLFDYFLDCTLFHNYQIYELNIMKCDVIFTNNPHIEYIFESNKSPITYSDNINSYSGEFHFINYFMNDEHFFNICNPSNEFKKNDNIITTKSILRYTDHRINTVTLKRIIKNEDQLRLLFQILRPIINTIKHTISNHFDIVNNRNELDDLL